ncbi:MAG: hypothetical protein A2X94_17110 [Bdellovibrionales bacterium GWB1_55_8]|nr:MAG: hypothetical protein A2X94_17110 [Bdellovibrionales bacterium GWB1_55_8]
MPLFTRNVHFLRPLRLSSRRKVALGTWDSPGDPSVYGIAEYDADAALAYIEKLRQETGVKITMSHFVGKALSVMIAKHPEINCMLRFGRLYPRKSIDACFLVASDETGKDLSAMVIREADKKSTADLAREMDGMVLEIREKGDPAFKQMKKTLGGIPGMLARTVINVSGFLMYALNIWTPLFGTPRDPFGSVIITNIGSLGLDVAFAPLVPYSRVPLLISIGSVREAPAVRDGKVIVARMIRLCVTFDHRLIDGVHAAKMSRTLEAVFKNPEKELAGKA